VIQAEAAEEVLDDQPERARQSLVRIQDSGREAMGEMRRLLGIIRGDDAADLAPQPRLTDIERLVDDARAAGLDATLAVEGTPRPLPPGVDLSAYRIVQEALTNVRKHAGRSAAATVLVRYADAALELEIADDGRGPEARNGGGHGLIGMRERAELFAGEFSAGPGEAGGFVVCARFALPASRP
jgi:signal transduction histidine kinase